MPSVKQVEVTPIKVEQIIVTIKGMTSLLTNKMSEEKKKDILDKQQKKPVVRRPKDPEADYQGTIYYTEDKKPGFPAAGVKKACVSACRFVDMKMTEARGAFFIMGDILPIIDGKHRMSEEMVRVQTSADIRYRAEYPEWSIDLPIRFNPNVISIEAIVNLLNMAGFHIGIGDWRPEKNGTHGMFEVTQAPDNI